MCPTAPTILELIMPYVLGFLAISAIVLLWAVWDIAKSPLGKSYGSD